MVVTLVSEQDKLGSYVIAIGMQYSVRDFLASWSFSFAGGVGVSMFAKFLKEMVWTDMEVG